MKKYCAELKESVEIGDVKGYKFCLTHGDEFWCNAKLKCVFSQTGAAVQELEKAGVALKDAQGKIIKSSDLRDYTK